MVVMDMAKPPNRAYIGIVLLKMGSLKLSLLSSQLFEHVKFNPPTMPADNIVYYIV